MTSHMLVPQRMVSGEMLGLCPSVPRIMLGLDLPAGHTAGPLAVQLVVQGLVLPVEIHMNRLMLIANLIMQSLMCVDSNRVAGLRGGHPGPRQQNCQ